MSRSFRKHPAGGITTCRSEKEDKRIANRRFRRITRQAVQTGKAIPIMREVANVYDMGKDGKKWHGWTPGRRFTGGHGYNAAFWWYKNILRK
jgi:hypothetical protein